MAVAHSGDRELVTLVRVYLSRPGEPHPNDLLHRAAHSAAERMETRFKVKGSSVQPQVGRWDGKAEPGYIVEVAVPFQGAYANLGKLVHGILQPMVGRWGLTFYVTLAREVVAMEVW